MGSRLDSVTDWTERAKLGGFKLSAIAVRLGVSPRHLRRYFWLRFRLSPKDWLQQHRMEAAKSLLDAEHTIKEVSAIVGFQNATHFSRAFKRTTGVSPGDYSHGFRACLSHDVRSGSEMSGSGRPCELR